MSVMEAAEQQDLVIDDGHLRLRRFAPSDAEKMFENWARDEDVARYVKWTAHEDIDETRQVLLEWCARYNTDRTWYQWCIELDGEPIGSITLFDVDVNGGTGEIGYCLGKRWWGRRIMTRCVGAVCAFAFVDVGLETLRIRHVSKNPASGIVAQHNRFVYERTDRDSVTLHDGGVDSLITYVLARVRWNEGILNDALVEIADGMSSSSCACA